MPDNAKLLDDAIKLGVENFSSTLGSPPESIKMLLEHAPSAFAGYGLIRTSIMREGALDLKTKELVLTLLDVLIGEVNGAKLHAAAAIRCGLKVEALTEGLVLCIMAGGMPTWNMTGHVVLKHAIAVRDELAKSPKSA